MLGKIILLLTLFFASVCQAQLAFTLKLSTKQIGRADQLQAEYEISNAANVEDFKPKDFGDWNVISGPEYSQQSISVNGQTSSSISYIYILSPKKIGIANVPGANIIADGKKLSCADAVVQVSDKQHLAVTQPQQNNMLQLPPIFNEEDLDALAQNNILKPGEKPDEKIRKNIFVKVSANKTTCFVGEPILVTYQLFSALENEAKVNRQPTFSGCSVIEMTDPNEQATMQTINGKTYKVFTIRKVQLIPLQEGELKLDTATVDNNVSFSLPDNPYQMQSYSATLPSNPLSILVKGLPEKNKPENFSGVVGDFNITANVDSTRISAGENNILKIKIEGQGNFSNIYQPIIKWSKNMQNFEGSDNQHVNKNTFPESGDITFQIPFIITHEGVDTIPAISFTFFNPETQTFKTVYTQPVSIVVTHAIPKENLQNSITEGASGDYYFWIIGTVALLAASFFIFLTNKKKYSITATVKNDIKSAAPKETFQQPAFKMKINFDRELEKLQNDNDNRRFFLQAKNILQLALQQKTDSASNSISTLISVLPKYTDNEAVIADAENIYKICNYSLYTPNVSEEEKVLLQARLEILIKKLEI